MIVQNTQNSEPAVFTLRTKKKDERKDVRMSAMMATPSLAYDPVTERKVQFVQLISLAGKSSYE